MIWKRSAPSSPPIAKKAPHSAFDVKWIHGRSDEPSANERISVGRGETCDIRFAHRSVSKVHAYLRLEASALSVIDLDSKNGTRVNGTLIAPHVAHPVEAGSRLQFGTLGTMAFDSGVMHDLLREIGQHESLRWR